MARRKRRKFTKEFKAEVAELCKRGDRSIGEVSRDFSRTRSTAAVRRLAERRVMDRPHQGGRDGESRTVGEVGSRLGS